MIRATVLTFIVALNLSIAGTQNRCGGDGSGPKPLADITTTFQSEIKGIPTQGSPEEFLFSEKDNSVIYRNEFAEIMQTMHFQSSVKLTESGKPLSRLIGGKGRYLAAEAAPWVYDRKLHRWYNYSLDARPFRHIFFNGDALYSISSRVDVGGNQIYQVFKYSIGDTKAVPVCKALIMKPGEHVTLAEGHLHPNVYFYRTFDDAEGKKIRFYTLNLGALCDFLSIEEYTREIAGPVKRAHIFSGMKSAFAVEVDHPEKNLLWDYKGCRYFHTEGRPLILNDSYPMIATWSEEKGMSLVYLEKESQAHLPPMPTGYTVRGLYQEDISMADDGVRLFLAPRFDWGARWLLQMTLSGNY